MDILTVLIVVLLILWLVGAFAVPVGGNLIHVLIVVVLVLVALKLLGKL